MKKAYTKPQIAVESFQLDAAVAAACSSHAPHAILNHTESTCTYDGGAFFNLYNCQFDLTYKDDDGNDTICYHGPTVSEGLYFINS